VGAAVCDQGVVQGNAMETLMAVREMAPRVHVMADVGVKHASQLGSRGIVDEARDAVGRGLASALIVTGAATGVETSVDDVALVKGAVPRTPVFVGSGVTPESVRAALEVADGVIVGSSIMVGGTAANAIDPARAARLVSAARG
jgi:membrane complex biogenesis BtpA family protein